MSGALCNACKATSAFGIIDFGQVAVHRYCAVGARFCAYAASDTADLANRRNFFAFALRRAGNEYWSGGGDTFYNSFGTSGNARSARYTSVGVNLRKSARNFYGVFGANGFTVAAAEASIRTSFVAAEERVARRASGISFVFEFVCTVFDSAVAFYNRNGGFFVFEFYAEKLCDFRFLFGGGNVAIGKASAAVGKLGGKSAAARTAEAAAVGDGKVIEDFRDFFVDVYLEYFAYDNYQRAD